MENIAECLADERSAAMVMTGCWRLVLNRRRARKLRKRGEDVRWSSYQKGWLWLAGY